MKTTFFLIISLISCSLLSQTERGVSPVKQSTTNNQQSTTYAVVIGISDYQNDDIPDLRFADKDAEAFVTYLKSPAGGSLPDERLKVLTNQNATTAQIAAALEWLVEVSGEDDQAIIYFSGHGDVETKTMFQLGYLLTWDSPARTYVAGAFPLSYLQAVVSTLALQNKSEVALITDACRAGKLAGTAVGGAQITNANLSKQFANEVKILSCQPDEFSIEGEQWGGGRGVFSYHLVDGLYGLADNNADGQVNLFEIGRYLEDKVSTEAAPHSQFPMTAGSRTALMAKVDVGALALLKEQRSKETPVLTAIDSKGFEEGILTGVDSVWQQKYQQFVAAVDAGQLLETPTGQPAAYDLFLELSQVVELKKLHGTMQRNLAAALQDDAQQAINAYLAANPNELARRYEAESDYQRYPRYLRKAAEILGEQNFYYPYVIAKLHYFEGLQMRLDADNKVENTSYEKAIELQLQALAFQEYAPFVLNELGVLYTRLNLSEKAIGYYEKAIELAPEWGLPYSNYCVELFYSEQYDKAIEYGEKALGFLPEFPQMYNFLGWIHANEYDWMSKQNWTRQGLELSKGEALDEASVSSLPQLKIKYKRTIELLERATHVDSSYALTYKNLGIAYFQIGEHEKAIKSFRRAIELDSTDWDSHYNQGRSYTLQGKHDDAEKAYVIALQFAPLSRDSAEILNSVAMVYKSRGEKEKFIKTHEKVRELNPRFSYSYSNQAYAHMEWAEFDKAEKLLLESIIIRHRLPETYRALGSLYTYHLNR